MANLYGIASLHEARAYAQLRVVMLRLQTASRERHLPAFRRCRARHAGSRADRMRAGAKRFRGYVG
jgi:hypothetical protein